MGMGLLQLNFALSSSTSSLSLLPYNHQSFFKTGLKNQFFDLTKKARISTRKTICSAKVDNGSAVVKDKSVSVILLAGGKGKRMGASMPKQYLPLLGQPIALYSFHTFSHMIQVKEIVVVCDPSYSDIFEETKEQINVDLKFSLPGKERQDSVYSGLQKKNFNSTVKYLGILSPIFKFLWQDAKEVDLNSELVCIHDSARPLVLSKDVEKVLKDGLQFGAAVLGVPSKATIKEADVQWKILFEEVNGFIDLENHSLICMQANSESFVVRTLDRKTLWEMQTPQVIKPDLLKRGFELVNREGLEVTDDVSIVEHLKHPVYITEGSYSNIKVTTPDDLLLAERILNLAESSK